jgi:hypothetical protein
MLLDIAHTIIGFVVLVTRLTTEELSDKQRMVLIDQFTHLQGLDAAFQLDLHDLLMILLTILIIVFGRCPSPKCHPIPKCLAWISCNLARRR